MRRGRAVLASLFLLLLALAGCMEPGGIPQGDSEGDRQSIGGDDCGDQDVDTDGDGLLDCHDADDDDDGFDDEDDAFPTNPSEQVDTDGDGVGDNTDNCPKITNADQGDENGDGVGDACEKDRDGDGVPDDQDEFPDDGNEWRDLDKDGIGDNADNCPSYHNADQDDADNDGIGDPCEPDGDGDGIPDDQDAFPADGTEWTDADGDGIGDIRDNCPAIFNEDQADSDSDGRGDPCDGFYGRADWDYGHWVSEVYEDPCLAQGVLNVIGIPGTTTVLAATEQGICRSTNGGHSWSEVLGLRGDVWRSVDDEVIYASQGLVLHRSLDHGNTWTTVRDFSAGGGEIRSVATSESGEVLVGKQEPAGNLQQGVWRFDPTQATWGLIPYPEEMQEEGRSWIPWTILSLPGSNDFVIGVEDGNHVAPYEPPLLTYDAANDAWIVNRIGWHFLDVTADANGQVLYAREEVRARQETGDFNQARLSISTDGGRTWTYQTPPPGMPADHMDASPSWWIHAHRTEPGWLVTGDFLCRCDDTHSPGLHGIWFSFDQGASWQEMANSGEGGIIVTDIDHARGELWSMATNFEASPNGLTVWPYVIKWRLTG